MSHSNSRLFRLMAVVVGIWLIPTVAMAQDTANGEAVFGGTCVACHGEDGSGAFGGVPDLSDRLAKSDDELFDSVRNGFESPSSIMAMPANGGDPSLSEQDVRDVIAYMRENFAGH